MDLSFDEVPKANNTNCNYWVASVSFVKCGVPYPFRVVEKHMKRDNSNVKSLYGPIIQDLTQAGLKVRHILADAKERKRLLGMATITATQGCECCEAMCKRKVVGKKLRIFFPRYFT